MPGFLKKSLRITGWTLGGLLGLLVLAYLLLLAINWRDRPPSSEALRMAALLDDRPPVADADNAFVYMLGLTVPEGVDVQEAGAKRRDWILAVNRDSSQFDHPPDIADEGLGEADELEKQSFRKSCRGEAIECAALLDAFAANPRFSALEQRRLSRYRELLKRRTWRESIPLDLRMPIARYSDVMHGQELYFKELRSLARAGAATEVRARLEADLEFWREVNMSSDFLITKMISVAAIRQLYFVGNLVIRSLPREEQLASVPDAWRRETSARELAMHQVMAGELRYATFVMREWLNFTPWQQGQASNFGPSLPMTITASLSRPLFQVQDQHNYYATQSLGFAARFQVPLQRYEAVTEVERSRMPREFQWRFYNLPGWIIRNLAGDWGFADYPMRVASVEAMRRAALLTVQLRSHGVATAQVPEALRESELRNPFDLQAFHWSEEEQAVVHEGKEKSSVKRHVYLY